MATSNGRGTSGRAAAKLAWKNGTSGLPRRCPRRFGLSQRRRHEQWRLRAIRESRESIGIDAAGGLRCRFARSLSREFDASPPEAPRPV